MPDLTPGPAPTPAQAQCGACKQTFSGVTLFDRHRVGGQCADPRRMMIAIRQDARGVWRGADPRPSFRVIGSAADGRTAVDA